MSESIAEMITSALHPKDAEPAPAPEPVTTTPAPVVETQRPPTPEVTPAPEPTPVTPQPEPAKPEMSAKESGFFQGMLDERDKRKKAEERVKALEEWRAQQEARQTPVPSIQDDPDGYAQHLAQETAKTRLQTVFDISEVMAREKHGDEPVTGALQWGMEKAQASPSFAAEYIRQKHPVDWVIRQQKAEGVMAEISKDETAYIRRRAAELGMLPATDAPAAPAATQPAAPIAPQPAPPRSLASAPSAGGPNTVPTHGLAAFDAAFSRGSG